MAHFTIATVAERSADFRRVLWTGRHTQLVIMTIPPGGEIGQETHEGNDQILTFVSGTGQSDDGHSNITNSHHAPFQHVAIILGKAAVSGASRRGGDRHRAEEPLSGSGGTDRPRSGRCSV